MCGADAYRVPVAHAPPELKDARSAAERIREFAQRSPRAQNMRRGEDSRKHTVTNGAGAIMMMMMGDDE